MAKPLAVRCLDYAFEVIDGEKVVVVIILDWDDREFWCCHCGGYQCRHAAAVLHRVIEDESE